MEVLTCTRVDAEPKRKARRAQRKTGTEIDFEDWKVDERTRNFEGHSPWTRTENESSNQGLKSLSSAALLWRESCWCAAVLNVVRGPGILRGSVGPMQDCSFLSKDVVFSLKLAVFSASRF